MENDLRWKQRFSNFKKAFGQLSEFIEKDQLNKFEVQGLIQCFEYTFELAWKTIKDYLEQEGFFDVKTPRAVLKTAFQIQLITDGHAWIDALEKRNLMAHTYSEERVVEVENLIRKKYYQIIQELYSKLENSP